MGVLALSVLLAASAAWHWSTTYDESNHLEMGRRIVQQWDFSRFDNSKMPVSAFNYLGHTAAWGGPDEALFGARLVQLGWLVGTALVVFFALGTALSDRGLSWLLYFSYPLCISGGTLNTYSLVGSCFHATVN